VTAAAMLLIGVSAVAVVWLSCVFNDAITMRFISVLSMSAPVSFADRRVS